MAQSIHEQFKQVVAQLHDIWLTMPDAQMEEIEAAMHAVIEANGYKYENADGEDTREHFYETMNSAKSDRFSYFVQLCEDNLDYGQSREYGTIESEDDLIRERNGNIHRNF